MSHPFEGTPLLRSQGLWDFDELLREASAPVDWVWEGTIARGNVVVLAGEPGGGKTSLVFLLVAALSAHEPLKLFGRMLTPMLPEQWAVIVEGEQSEASSARKLLSSYRTLGLPDRATHRTILLARKSIRLGDSTWLEVASLVAQGLVGHIVLDTLARVAPGESNDEREQTATFDVLARCIEGAGAYPKPTVWVLCHTKKGAGTGHVEDVSGSGARAGQADTVALLRSNREDGLMHSATLTWPKVRDGEPVAGVTYRLRDGVLEPCEPPVKRRGPTRDTEDDEVLEHLRQHPEASANEVWREVGGDRNRVMRIVRDYRGSI